MKRGCATLLFYGSAVGVLLTAALVWWITATLNTPCAHTNPLAAVYTSVDCGSHWTVGEIVLIVFSAMAGIALLAGAIRRSMRHRAWRRLES